MTFPALDLTGFDLSKLNPTTIELPRPLRSAGGIAGAMRYTAYVGVGLAVLGVQRVQWERRQVEKRLRQLGT